VAVETSQDVLTRLSRYFTDMRIGIVAVPHHTRPNLLHLSFGILPTAEIVLHVVGVVVPGCFDELSIVSVVVPLVLVRFEDGLGATDDDTAV